jgi:manganese oxidase
MSARACVRASARLWLHTLLFPLFLFPAVASAASYTFYIKAGTHTINGAGGTTINVWGYTDNPSAAPMVPGPVIEAQENELVTVYVYNQDSRPHNFVVAGLTSDANPIAAGDNKTYTFTTTNAGVYLYSDTLNSNVNREMGLYGAVVVRAAGGAHVTWTGGPSYDVERLWVVSDMDKPRWNDVASKGGTVNTSVYKPNYSMINGLGGFDAMRDPNSQVSGTLGQVVLVRIVNAGQFDQSLHFHGNHMQAVVLDSVRVTPFGDDTINVKAGKSAMVLYPIKYAKQTFPVHVHTAQMETANGVYLNGAATLIVGK